MVLSGAPIYTPHHAEYITDFALSAIEATSKINDPSTNNSLKIRVGRSQRGRLLREGGGGRGEEGGGKREGGGGRGEEGGGKGGGD